MSGTQVRIGIVSYGRLSSIIRELEPTLPAHVELEYVEGIMEEIKQRVEWLEANRKVDIFVSSGGNNTHLARYVHMPLVELELTGMDLFKAILAAGRNGDRACLISHYQRVPHLSEVLELLKVEILERTYQNVMDIDNILEEMRAQGIYDILGSSLIIERAKMKGMRGHYIYSQNSAQKALNQAIQMATNLKNEMRPLRQLNSVLNTSCEGIVATDSRGIITLFNPSAEKIFGLVKGNVIGKRCRDVLPEFDLSKTLESGLSRLNQIKAFRSANLLANQVPILDEGQNVIGALLTVQDADVLEKVKKRGKRRETVSGFSAQATFDSILHRSKAMKQAISLATQYAGSDATVLLWGETGSGKELFSQSIHNASSRARDPFVAINCAALPPSLLESELFGYEEGAFTGAKKGGHSGVFELAQGGTLFLDEISESSLEVQARLLRVLETQEIFKVGSEKIIRVDVRIIASTNKDLRKLIEEKKFREDLFYRLNVLNLSIPPLRERLQDIPLLMYHYLRQYCGELSDKKLKAVASMPAFTEYRWPGNVRELRNVAERYALVHQAIGSSHQAVQMLLAGGKSPEKPSAEMQETLHVLELCGGSKSKAAEMLHISRTTLWRRLRNLGIE